MSEDTLAVEVEGELDELASPYVLVPEVRPAIASMRFPVVDDDGFVTHYEVRDVACAVHTLQTGRNGWVCEFEDGTISVIGHENVRFVDAEDD